MDTETIRVVDHDVRPLTVPGESWTCWNRGLGPGDSYLENEAGRDWSHPTGHAAAGNLVALAASPIPAPES